MKKKLCSLFFALCALLPFGAGKTAAAEASKEVSLDVGGKAAYLMDYDSMTPVYARGENERLPIASMCKIMTLILCFDEIENGTLAKDEMIPVSAKAASMGGSQVFLQDGLSYRAEELIKSIIVCSANDSCVAMAERVAGSDDLFVDKMNARARELGAADTLFANCTGLPKPTQYSTAHDVALMLRELLRHEDYFSFSRIWTETFHHPDDRVTEITNTNKMVRSYQGCDGGKTGFTNQAGFCLAATAKRGDLRLIAVVIGADSGARRFESVGNLFDFAFANYTQKIVVDDAIPLADKVRVRGGKRGEVAAVAERKGLLFSRKDSRENNVEIRFLPDGDLKAPVARGDKVGEIILFKDNIEYDRIPAVAFEADEKMGFGDAYKQAANSWKFSFIP